MNIKVGDVKRTQLESYSRDTFNSLSPLTWLLKLFAMNNSVKDLSYSKTTSIIKSVISIIIIGSIDLFSLYYRNVYIYTSIAIVSSVKFTDTVQSIYDLFQYIFDLCYIYVYGRDISLQYFRQYECIDEILGMNYYSEIKWKLVKLIGFFTFIWLSTSISDYLAWYFSFGWVAPTIYAITYLFLYQKILSTLDLTSHVIHIKYRLMIISDNVQQCYSIAETLQEFKGNFISHKHLLYANVCSQTDSQRASTVTLQVADEYMEIKWMSRCYLQLTEQVKLINEIFGYRILLNSLSLLIDIIRFTNIAVRLLIGTQVLPHETMYFPVVSSLMRQMTCIIILYSLVHHCEQAYSERDKIISIIDVLLINKNPSNKLREAVVELRDLMLARPINLNLAKFFRLDKKFLVSIASVVVTYTIILLQSMN